MPHSEGFVPTFVDGHPSLMPALSVNTSDDHVSECFYTRQIYKYVCTSRLPAEFLLLVCLVESVVTQRTRSSGLHCRVLLLRPTQVVAGKFSFLGDLQKDAERNTFLMASIQQS